MTAASTSAAHSILVAAGIMGGLGVFFATLLAVAYRFLKVEEDPRIDTVEEMLPASNCGACGEPGCRAFAEKVVGGEVAVAKCTVSSPEGIEEIADFLGVAAGAADKRVARLRCAGGDGLALRTADYQGFESCGAAALVASGGKGCTWGCLGLADCEVACGFDAIAMTDHRLPRVDVAKCTACGDCVEACPKDLLELLSLSAHLLVQCKAPLSGDDATAVCAVACDACGRCATDAPDGLITMVHNLPVIDRDSGIAGGSEATHRCPTGAITVVGGRGQLEAYAVVVPGGYRDVG